MLLKAIKRNIGKVLVLVMTVSLMCVPSMAKDIDILDGQILISDTQDTVSGDATKITATVKGSMFSKKTNTITITNQSGKTGELSFSYYTDKANSFKIGGAAANGNGPYSVVLDDNATLVLEITSNSGFSNLTATLTMSSISFVEAAASSNVTFSYDSALGNVTVSGETVKNADVVEIPVSGAELVATPASGAKFIGWVYEKDHAVVPESAASFTYRPTEDVTLRAVFASASTEACFWASNKAYLFESLGTAINHASSASDKTIVLASDGTLTGSHTIPAGVTLLIPYNDANTLCTTKPTQVESKSTPSVYRMLTMAAGANIAVNGAISVGGQQYVSRPIGAVSGKYGVIEMESGSSITVNNGGNLYVWGYIAGVTDSNKNVSEGTVTIKSGGTVYEDFQVVDWRGGDASQQMVTNSTYKEKKVFPMSQYYIQNVQVPMTLETGATENTFTSVKITLVGIQNLPVTFIGTGGMFTLGSNSVVIKDYDEKNDRMVLELIEGSANLGNISMSLKFGILSTTVDINSKDYVLPVTNNITIRAKSGTAFSAANDVSLLPGAEIIIDQGASCTMSSGSFYIYDLDEWMYEATEGATEGGYCSEFNRIFEAVPYAHDRAYTRKQSDLKDAVIQVNGTVDISNAYAYTTTGGANICSEGGGIIKMKAGLSTAKTYQVIQVYKKGELDEYKEIPINSAYLKNADGTYVATDYPSDAAATYEYKDGRWSTTTRAAWVQDGMTVEYQRLASAVAASDGSGYIQMLANTEEPGFTIDQATMLDLAGKTVTLTSPLTNPTNLSVIDSATNGFDADGGKIVCSAATSFPALTQYSVSDVSTKYYITVDLGSNTYAFPRVATALTGIQYVLNSAGDAIEYLIFENTFRGNSVAAGVLADMGFQLSVKTWFVQDDSTANKISPKDRATVYYGTSFTGTSGATTTVQSLLGFGGYTADTSKYDVEVPSLTTTITVGENGTSITPETPIPTTTGS